MTKQKEDNKFEAYILTPYLDPETIGAKKNLVCSMAGWRQIIKTVNGTDFLSWNMETEGLKIDVNEAYYSRGHTGNATPRRERVISLPNTTGLIISGNTYEGEQEASTLSNEGLLVARYSQFYGDSSSYIRNSPEQSGYSFDFPKRHSVVAKFLGDRATLDAILEKNPAKVKEAIGKLNTRLDEPILITSQLERIMG